MTTHRLRSKLRVVALYGHEEVIKFILDAPVQIKAILPSDNLEVIS